MTGPRVMLLDNQLRNLTKGAKERLRAAKCPDCGFRMDYASCGKPHNKLCTVDARRLRAAACLRASRSETIRKQADAIDFWVSGAVSGAAK